MSVTTYNQGDKMGKFQFKKEDTYTFYKLHTEINVYTKNEEIIAHVSVETLDKRIGGFNAYLRLPLIDHRDIVKIINAIEDALGYIINQKVQQIMNMKEELDIYNYKEEGKEEEKKVEVKDENQ